MAREILSNSRKSDRPLEAGAASGAGGYAGLVHILEDGRCRLVLHVQGVYCAACIQKIEHAMRSFAAVEEARLNFSTHRLSVVWSGEAALADDLVRAVEDLGYGVHPYDPGVEESESKKKERFLLLCLGVAGFAMGNVMLISVGLWTTTAETMGMATREFMHWISAFIALPVILFSGRPFFRSALRALSSGRANMDVPISLALLLAGGMSLFETVQGGEHVYFDSALMLMFFLLIGRYLDFRARKQARSAAVDLLESMRGFASVVTEKGLQKIAIQDLQQDMIVQVAAGEKFPADGLIETGKSAVDTALVTGETVPQAVEPGASVYAGTINMEAPLTMRVQKSVEDSLLADIARLMEEAEQGQARYVRLADRAARLYTPVVHTLALLAFLGWFFAGGLVWQEALMIAVTVLIITCPCALGLAVPVVQVLASGQLMRRGVLMKSGDALERLAVIDTVFLDKTGTLTRGKPELVGSYAAQDLKLAASLAAQSHHVLAQALLQVYDGELAALDDVEEVPGEGMRTLYKGKELRLGSRDFCGDSDAPVSAHSELWLQQEGAAPLCFQFADQLRSDSAQIVAQLQAKGLEVVLLSGDREAVVSDVAKTCGIARFYAQQKPDDKYCLLREARERGANVLMVGDGLNDAPVLAGAGVSMAPGSAIDMAQNAADIVFMGERFSPVLETWTLARRSQSLVRQNFMLAVLYNLVAIPLALAGMVTPLVAAIAMSGSSLVVIANSFRLKLGSGS